MIKDIRVVEWVDEAKNFKWDIQVMREGSDEWEPVTYVQLERRPEEVSREDK
jgi:hypothetical protein